MRYFGCDSCATVVKVIDRPDEVQRLIYDHPMWKERRWPCVTTGCSGPMADIVPYEIQGLEKGVQEGLIRYRELTAQEFFQALCGFGMPDELGAAPEVVQALLLSAKICDLGIKRSRSGRTILDRIDLDNGTSLHLASAPAGPTVFKVTRRRDETDDDHRGILPDSEGRGVQGEDLGGPGDEGGGAGDGGEGPGASECQPDVDGQPHRDAAPDPEGASWRAGDHDPGAGGAAEALEEAPGLRAGPEDDRHHPERPGEGQGDVRANR